MGGWANSPRTLDRTLASGMYRYTVLGYERELGPDLRTLRGRRQF